MSNVGIEDIGIYIPQTYVSMEELAKGRNVDAEKYTLGLGQRAFAVPLSNEDTVTLAANALEDLLTNSDVRLADIGRLVVATETPVDYAKTVSNYLAGLFDLPGDCELYEAKHSCIAGTYALFDAMNWIRSGQSGGRKAVVICSDIARHGLWSPAEPTQGAGAVALLVSDSPGLLSIDEVSGIASGDAKDFWRPLGSEEAMVEGRFSIECYLEALEKASYDYTSKGGSTAFDYLVFHTPFAKMARKAYDRLATLLPGLEGRFAEMTAPSLDFCRWAGNIYTGSLYLSLASLLSHEQGRAVGKRVGMFSFGSGYSARLFYGTMEGSIGDIGPVKGEEIPFREYESLRKGDIRMLKQGGFLLDAIDEGGYRHYVRD